MNSCIPGLLLLLLEEQVGLILRICEVKVDLGIVLVGTNLLRVSCKHCCTWCHWDICWLLSYFPRVFTTSLNSVTVLLVAYVDIFLSQQVTSF
jgi:hypothetical protein